MTSGINNSIFYLFIARRAGTWPIVARRVARVTTSRSDLGTGLGTFLLSGLVQTFSKVAGLDAFVAATGQFQLTGAAAKYSFQMTKHIFA